MKQIAMVFLHVLLVSSSLRAQSRFGASKFTTSGRENHKNDKGNNGKGTDNGGGNGSNTNAPFDGGLCALLAAGALYGAKRFSAKKQ